MHNHVLKGKNIETMEKIQCLKLTAALNDEGRRLDRILRKALPDMSLSCLHRLLRTGRIRVNDGPAQASHRIHSGDSISIDADIPVHDNITKPTPEIRHTLDILYEDEGLLILNKPAGVPVHGQRSMEQMVQSYLDGRIDTSLSFRSGPLHRLDQPTSGVLVFSKSLSGAHFFSSLLQSRRVKKRYLAIVNGIITGPERWEDRLFRDRSARKTAPDDAGSQGITEITPLLTVPGFSFVRAEIQTGRTHQIRAQAAIHGHPLSGDGKYGGSHGIFFLHAYSLEIPFPAGPRSFYAPVPEDFRRRLLELFGDTITELLALDGHRLPESGAV
ncbi:pseudouridine synthase [Spirochaetia bacterium]|nr:pseudouridine synthase [Spirochaetia bacterium]